MVCLVPLLKTFLNSEDFKMRFDLRNRLSRKSFSSGGTSGFDDVPSADRFHSGPESVSLRSFSAIGLVSSLHGILTPKS